MLVFKRTLVSKFLSDKLWRRCPNTFPQTEKRRSWIRIQISVEKDPFKKCTPNPAGSSSILSNVSMFLSLNERNFLSKAHDQHLNSCWVKNYNPVWICIIWFFTEIDSIYPCTSWGGKHRVAFDEQPLDQRKIVQIWQVLGRWLTHEDVQQSFILSVVLLTHWNKSIDCIHLFWGFDSVTLILSLSRSGRRPLSGPKIAIIITWLMSRTRHSIWFQLYWLFNYVHSAQDICSMLTI